MSKSVLAAVVGLAVLVGIAVGPVGPVAAGNSASPLGIAAPRIAQSSAVQAGLRTSNGSTASAGSTASTAATASIVAELAASTITPATAVSRAQSEASANGITSYISVTNRATGVVLAQTSNAGTQVASESVMKLMLASYYLVLVGGYQNQSESTLAQLSYMIRYSDDATANAYFTSAAVPTIAARYGMRSTINATDRVGHWGAVRITARDMTTFLFRAAHDSEVGPWLMPVMAQVAPYGSDGFNQAFGMNSLSGTHGSKQGWGDDQFWTSAQNVINSVGYTDRYYVAILQNSYSYPDPARATSTYAARSIAASTVVASTPAPAPLENGDYVRSSAAGGIYRLAGGAPISVTSWSGLGGPQPVRTISVAQWNALRKVPVDGTFLRSTKGQVFRTAGGAPMYLSTWAGFGGIRPTITVDAQAIVHAGQAGSWSHLRAFPVDGTFITTTGRHSYRIVGGAPTYIADWAHFGGQQPAIVVDPAVVTRAGQGGVWAHLRKVVPDNTFIDDAATGETYRVAGGAPVFVSTWAVYGGPKPTQRVDSAAINQTGNPAVGFGLRAVPADGTYLRRAGSLTTFRVAGGAPLVVTDIRALGGHPAPVDIDQAAIANSGGAAKWKHLHRYPVDGTFLVAVPTGLPYQVRSAHPVRIGTNSASAVPINQLTIDRAGRASPYNNLR